MSYSTALLERLKEAAVEEDRKSMEAYMRNQFRFLGLRSQVRQRCLQEHIKANGLPPKAVIRATIQTLWQQEYREVQYCAQELFHRGKYWKEEKSISLIQEMLLTHSWWDTVDYIAANLCGSYFKSHPSVTQSVVLKWNASKNIWLIRSSILFQLKYKDQTDLPLLEKLIIPHIENDEFFLRKAIGWALRQVSKHNPEYVRSFVNLHQLKPLSLREATKYL